MSLVPVPGSCTEERRIEPDFPRRSGTSLSLLIARKEHLQILHFPGQGMAQIKSYSCPHLPGESTPSFSKRKSSCARCEAVSFHISPFSRGIPTQHNSEIQAVPSGPRVAHPPCLHPSHISIPPLEPYWETQATVLLLCSAFQGVFPLLAKHSNARP